jgi:hypothetical protein
MLTAYRVGVTELWTAMVATARALPGVPDSGVIDLAGAVFDAQNTYSDAALAAYRDEAREMLRTRERTRLPRRGHPQRPRQGVANCSAFRKQM